MRQFGNSALSSFLTPTEYSTTGLRVDPEETREAHFAVLYIVQ